MSNWVPYKAAAVAIAPYVANGDAQISILAGDQFQIFHKNEEWVHVQNYLSKAEGIVPLVCLYVTESEDKMDSLHLFGNQNDLLIFEAKMTLRFALNVLKSAQPALASDISEALFKIVSILTQFETNSIPVEKILKQRKNLAVVIDSLRETLKLSKPIRTSTSALNTVTTTSRELFQHINTRSHSREPEYIVFHIDISSDQFKKPVQIRAFIFNKIHGDLSTSVSATLSQNQPLVSLIFDQFERKNMNNTLYLVVYTTDPQSKELISCSIADLPSCRKESSFNVLHDFDLSTFTSTNASYISRLHQYLISPPGPAIQKTIQPSLPYYKAAFTCYFNPTHVIIEQNNLGHAIIVPPLKLPSSFSPSLKRSVITVTYTSIVQHLRHKKIRLVTYLIDNKTKTFVKGLENPDTHVLDSEFWNSNDYKSEKSFGLHDSFQVDVSSAKELTDYFIGVELERISPDEKTFPYAFGMIPLANEIGAAHANLDKTTLYGLGKLAKSGAIANFQRTSKEDKVGEIDFVLSYSSTQVTTDLPLFKLINFKKFPQELSSSISDFANCGFNEWCKFMKPILSSLCEIISTYEQFANSAFDQLLMVMTEILTKSDYIPLLDHFVNSELEPETCPNIQAFKNLSLRILPLIVDMIALDRNSQEFRKFIKCLPYLLQLTMRSYVLHHIIHNQSSNYLISSKVSEESVPKNATQSVMEDAEIMLLTKKSVDKIMNFLNSLIKEIPKEDEDQQLKSKLFTNQSLILQHYPSIIDALLKGFLPSDLAPYVCKFLSSIRYIENEKTQLFLDKLKIKIILSLSTTELWINPDSRRLIKAQFTEDLMKASKFPHCIDLFIQTLASLFFTIRDDFIIQFIDPCENLIKVNENCRSSLRRLLLTVAFHFPNSFPPELFLFLISQSDLAPPELLFIFSHYVNEILQSSKSLKSKKDKKDVISQILTSYLEVAAKAGHQDVNKLDQELMITIYPQNVNFKILKHLSGLTLTLIKPILQCYLIYKAPEIKEAFIFIINEDIKKNKVSKEVKKPTLQGLYLLSTMEGFTVLSELFEKNDGILEGAYDFFREYKKLVQCLNDLKNMEVLMRNEDSLGEAITSIIYACLEVNDTEILPFLISKLVDLEQTCKNFLEAGETILLALKLVPPDFNRAPPFMDIGKKLLNANFNIDNKQVLTGIEFHMEVLLKAIDYFFQAKMEEFALPLLEQIKNDFITPYHLRERLQDVYAKEAKIFETVSEVDRLFSNYYFVGFYGGGFGEYYSGRCFIYRRMFHVQTNAMVAELQEKFPGSKIDAKPPTDDQKNDKDGMYIQILPVTAVSNEELNDKFIRKNVVIPKYMILFNEHKSPCVFRYEKSIKDKSKTYCNEFAGIFLEQHYFLTKFNLPYIVTRCEISQEKTIMRTLSPLENAIIAMNRKNEELRTNNFQFSKLLKRKNDRKEDEPPIVPDAGQMSSFAMSLNGTVNAAVNGGNTMYIEAFLSETYEKENPSDAPLMYKLKQSFKEQVDALEIGLEIHDKLVSDSMRALHETIVQGFAGMKKDLQPIVEGVTTEFD